MEKVTGKYIIDEVQTRIANMKNVDLSKSVGALNGIDMKTYSKGYIDALQELKSFFETRV